jgi:preprotein translocase subunit SecE
VVDAVATERPAALVRWGRQAADFLVSVRAELGKVTWPTRDELIKATRMILILAVTLGFVIGMLDLLLNLVLVEWLARLTA